MKVLHVNKYLYRRGGVEGYMLDLTERYGPPENPSRPYRLPGALPSLRVREPPSGIVRRLTTAAKMVYSPAGRRGVPPVLALHDYKLLCSSYQLLENGRVCPDRRGC
jgi:hypothetical protein